MNKAYVIGVGLTNFGRYDATPVEELARDACFTALDDAGVEWKEVQALYAAHVNQGVAAGQRVIREVGPSGIAVLNVENCSAAASTAVREATIAISAGVYDLVVVVGFEKMNHGVLLNVHPSDSPETLMGMTVLPMRFALMARRHMAEFGTTIEEFALVSVKNHHHAVNNPKAQFPKPVTLEEVLGSRMICDPITLLQCSPNSDGAAAAVISSERYLRRHGGRAVQLVSSGLTSDISEQAFNQFDLEMVGRAARQAYEGAGLGPGDLDVIELHDCFSVAEILEYEALGLCKAGEGGRLISEGVTELGGRLPVNTDGGLLAKGHPLGATGLGMIAEIVSQLRGEAGPRQVPGARVGLTCNIGMWSACVHVLRSG